MALEQEKIVSSALDLEAQLSPRKKHSQQLQDAQTQTQRIEESPDPTAACSFEEFIRLKKEMKLLKLEMDSITKRASPNPHSSGFSSASGLGAGSRGDRDRRMDPRSLSGSTISTSVASIKSLAKGAAGR